MTKKNKEGFPRGMALVLIYGLVLVCLRISIAQEATGKILGTVTDQQGAVIPGAKITITNTDTKLSREMATDKDGNFHVVSLPIGMYIITVEHEGFKKEISPVQKLEINQSLRIDPKLEVGSIAETVEVLEGAAVVETVNATLGHSVTSRPIVNLPLNGRNVLTLALLQPGVSEHNPADGSAGLYNVGGGRSDSVTFLLDGGINNNLLSNGVVYNPNPDTIAEFRILESNYTAEYGRNGGGVISVVTKSGTNEIHGSAFDFLRNDALNANSFFNNRNGVPKEILKRNQFGFTAGGPITIPKVVNGKDRFFFFVGYQGQRLVQKQTTASVTTFTPAELSGDYSLSNSSHTGPDLDVVKFLQANPFFQPNASLASRGIIDPSKINSIAQKYISNHLIPTSSSGQLVSQGTLQNNNDELTLKFDFNMTPRDRLSVTLGALRNPTLTPFSGGANVNGYPILGNSHRYFSNISYSKTLSPSLLNEFRFTAQRNNGLQAVPGLKAPTASELGIGVTPDNPTGPPRLTFNKGLTIGFSPQGPTNLIDNTFAYSDTLSWIRGKHNWKFGATFSPYQNNTVFDFFVNGNFFFSGPNGGIGSGNDFADFLLGLPDEYLQFGEAPSDIRTKSTYFFAQDEWHVRHNLTLTLGIRYEYSQPKVDTRGRSFSLKLGQQSTVFPNAPIGLLFPGDPQAPSGANFPDKNDWAPRFGIAWDPWGDGKTSIRAGFGVFYDILKGEDNLQFNGQAPFFGFSDLFFDPLSGNPGHETNYLSQPYVATGVPNSFPSRPPAHNLDFDAAGFLPFGGGGVFFVDPHLRTPYTYQFNLSVQRELTGGMVAEVSYVGNSSHKLTSLTDANPFILGTKHRLFNTQPGDNDLSFSFLDEFRNLVTANYNSLQMSLLKRVAETRFLGTTYFSLSYTYAHNIDNASGFRERNSRVPPYNAQQFRSSSDFDIRQRISFSGGWDLPLNHWWSSGPGRLTRGWSLYPIISYRTGFPLDVFAGLSRSRTRPGPSAAGDGNLVRANLVGSSVSIFNPSLPQSFNNRPGNYWFNPANFSTAGLSASSLAPVTNPSLRTYGTLPRNAFPGPGRTNVDFAIAKVTPIIGERFKSEFRAEFFNLFNHAEFSDPTTNFSSGSFGQITTTADPRIIQFALKLIF